VPTDLKWEPEEISEGQERATLSDGERLLCILSYVKPSAHFVIAWWNILDATQYTCPKVGDRPTQEEARAFAEAYVRDRRGKAQTS
jgi:hypothetical protein